jgi:hypothetical protein
LCDRQRADGCLLTRFFAEYSTAAPVARITALCRWQPTCGFQETKTTMPKPLDVPRELFDACALAKFAVASAIEDLDFLLGDVLGDDSPAIQYPDLIAGYLAFAGSVYAASIVRKEMRALN